MTKREAIVKSIINQLDVVLKSTNIKDNSEILNAIKILRDEMCNYEKEMEDECPIKIGDIEFVDCYISRVDDIQRKQCDEYDELAWLKLMANYILYMIK